MAGERDERGERVRAERRRRGLELQRRIPRPHRHRPRPDDDRWTAGDSAEFGCCLLGLVWTTAAVAVLLAVGVRRARGRAWVGGRRAGRGARRRGSS